MSSATRGPTRTGNSQQQALQIAAQEDDMNALVNFIAAIRRDNEGQDLLEYALLVALIAVLAVGSIQLAGASVNAAFRSIATPGYSRGMGRSASA
jgi:Flp pilus assembly pilin Flp